MATPIIYLQESSVLDDDSTYSSDYGSEFGSDEEKLLNELLAKLPTEPRSKQQYVENNEENTTSSTGQAAGVFGKGEIGRPASDHLQTAHHGKSTVPVEMEFQLDSANVQNHQSRKGQGPELVGPSKESNVEDTRSPLERFRSAPRKPLSVTDIISPAWCELQYWYSLTKHGRVRATPAMRQGSVVHKTLEDQVHKTVAVTIRTKEDAWGLRIWNVIQGLQTLRETGITRELEVWGVVDGLIVNGVIDELSYICPDRELESQAAAKSSQKRAPNDSIPQNQASITDFLGTLGATDIKGVASKGIHRSTERLRKVYLTDVKTRGSTSIPKGASFRATLMQLMLYHKLFSNMADNKVDTDILFSRYSLNASQPFTDHLIAQLGSLNEVFYDAPEELSQGTPDTKPDSVQILLENNSLNQLWRLMIKELQRTLPLGLSSIGDVLKAEYRTPSEGSMIGAKSFLYDDDVLQNYLDDEISWWKGERKAQGVVIEEAYKCRSCEFAEECTWRKTKIEEALSNHRSRKESHG